MAHCQSQEKIGKITELKFGVRDILAQDVLTQQTFEYTNSAGEAKSSTVTNRRFNLGRTWSLGVIFKL